MISWRWSRISSLVSVLGVTDITQLGKVTAAGNFRYFETYNVVALIYLTMTITLSLALAAVGETDAHMRTKRRDCVFLAKMKQERSCHWARRTSLAWQRRRSMTNPLLADWDTPFRAAALRCDFRRRISRPRSSRPWRRRARRSRRLPEIPRRRFRQHDRGAGTGRG